MDYSFSLVNLRRIWDIQTRKGNYLFSLFPELEESYKLYKSERDGLRAVIREGGLDQETYNRTRKKLGEIKREAEKLISEYLTATSLEIVSDMEEDIFSWCLELGSEVGGRQTYRLGEGPKFFFVDKQMQRNLQSVMPRRQNSRSQIISSLVAVIDNDMPKVVVRTDVKDFYGSIDHSIISAMIADSKLNPLSKKLIDKLLHEYSEITGSRRGLPVGVGLSSKLSELFISHVDRSLQEAEDVLYYARYVDDIVVVFSANDANPRSKEDFFNVIREKLSEIGLEANDKKEFFRELDDSNSFSSFEFLGYSISYSGRVKVKMSSRRVRRIKDRIDRSLKAWSVAEKNGANHAKRKLLIDRLKFLTGNTKLFNNKRNALVGVYFTNSHLTDFKDLQGLDKYLDYCLSRFEVPEDLRGKISKLSFEEGFQKRSFYNFSATQLRRIVGVWHEQEEN
ncbi:antiviral reverse transcriptase Drt3a [Nocardiopsis sp. NPDC057823]|uniref:antiviral reverse transcriptase Drt3a n=1 Tax=Nocardiopsis sp. NPDC057823 TaxID=3346256 RepID=UPI00366C4B7B